MAINGPLTAIIIAGTFFINAIIIAGNWTTINEPLSGLVSNNSIAIYCFLALLQVISKVTTRFILLQLAP